MSHRLSNRTRGIMLGLAAVAAAVVLDGTATGSPPAVQARAYVVRGGPDDAVLSSRAASARRPLASITKLMTVLVALKRVRLTDIVTVPPQAAAIGEASLFLRVGERITVHDLAIGALVPSANDAATALAAYAGGGSVSRFVALMNGEARSLGMHDTHFVNPHGLDAPGHVSSARDVVTLLTAALRVPFIRTWSTKQHATISGGRVVESTDDLLDKLPLVGAKTGHTDGAGWSQVAAVAEGGVRVTAAVLGSPTQARRDADLDALLRWGLAQYRPVRVIDAARTYALARTGYGRPPVPAVAARTVIRPAHVGKPLVERVVAASALPLPVRAGQRIGEVSVYDGTRLVADRAVAAPGRPARVRWYGRRTVHHLVGLFR